jgi:hypothetical protein
MIVASIVSSGLGSESSQLIWYNDKTTDVTFYCGFVDLADFEYCITKLVHISETSLITVSKQKPTLQQCIAFAIWTLQNIIVYTVNPR